MSCKKCHYEFCWLCMSEWSKHGYNYSCNVYVEDGKEKSDSRKALNRYLHFYDRFTNHKNSLKLENDVIILFLKLKY